MFHPVESFVKPDVEFCSINGNIMENAILACGGVDEAERFIDLAIRMKNDSNLVVVCSNSFDGKPRMKDGRFFNAYYISIKQPL